MSRLNPATVISEAMNAASDADSARPTGRTPPLSRKRLADPRFLLATGFGSGLAPLAPGTAGSLLALPLFLPLALLPPGWQLAAILAVALCGVLVAGSVSRELGREDHPAIVIDEVAGMWTALLALPLAPFVWLAAFLLFRLLDMVKPWPLRLLDERVKGGLGIMLDDLVAGLATCLALHWLLWALPALGGGLGWTPWAG